MMKLDDFKKFGKSEFFGSQYVHGGTGVDTAQGTSRDWAHTTVDGADSIIETKIHPVSEANDPL